jgi:membrane peptidoglycan carboxypeptidase
MLAMLATVFEKGQGEGTTQGTAASIYVPGFRCGGKTGTAHKYDPALRGYSPNRYLSSFAGLAPIDNPRLAIIVMVDEPSGGDYYGGKVAGPVFARVASESLRYLGVPGDKLIPMGPNGKPLKLDANGVPYKLDRWGNPIIPKPPKPEKKPVVAEQPAPPPEPVVVEPEPEPAGIVIPDFRGMGVGRALDEARKLRLDVEVVGSGQVIEQDPPPGPTTLQGRVKLRFSDDARRISAR